MAGVFDAIMAAMNEEVVLIDATGEPAKVKSKKKKKKRPSSAHAGGTGKRKIQPPRPSSARPATQRRFEKGDEFFLEDFCHEGICDGYEVLAEKLKSALAGAPATGPPTSSKSPYNVSVSRQKKVPPHHARPKCRTDQGAAAQYCMPTEASNGGLAWEVNLDGFTPRQQQRRHRPSSGKRPLSGKNRIKEEVVRNTATPETMSQMKVLDMHRWFCLSRPQYKTSCGLSSLVSCWNYLFSTLGRGSHAPISQEEALTVLGFEPPFGEISFGPFTGNKTLMRWFLDLNRYYGVRGRTFFQYKPKGKNQTRGVSSEKALEKLKEGLQGDDVAYIYHCENHYFCPIGYEDVPLQASHAYRTDLGQLEVETWILIGDPSRKHPGIHCKKWGDIDADLNMQSPEYLNIRSLHKGVQLRKTKGKGRNLHCIMAFKRSQWQGVKNSANPRSQARHKEHLETESEDSALDIINMYSSDDNGYSDEDQERFNKLLES